MDAKECSNHKLHIETLRRMTPEQRLMKAFELTEAHREQVESRVTRRFNASKQQLIEIRLRHCVRQSERKRRISNSI
jgi:hypothetical protein